MKKIFALCTVCVLIFFICGCVPSHIQQTDETQQTICATDQIEETEIPSPSETIQETVETTIPTETEPTKPANFQITLSFAGDCTLSEVTSTPQAHGFESFAKTQPSEYFLEKVKPIFESDDFTIVNLECVLSDQDLPKRDKGSGRAFWFKGSSSYAEILSVGDVEGVSLANNHTFDYKEAGYQDTKAALENVQVQYGYYSDVMYFEKEGFRIAVICHGLWSSSEADDIIKLIQIAEDQSDYQVVFYHGGTEAKHAPEDWRIIASRKLVDNGADLVIGNHPHVLQPIETYNNSQIVYSVGNFCYGGHLQPRNRTMIYQMTLTINTETLAVESSEPNVIPCYIYTTQYNNYQPTPIENQEEIDRVLKFLNQELELPY